MAPQSDRPLGGSRVLLETCVFSLVFTQNRAAHSPKRNKCFYLTHRPRVGGLSYGLRPGDPYPSAFFEGPQSQIGENYRMVFGLEILILLHSLKGLRARSVRIIVWSYVCARGSGLSDEGFCIFDTLFDEGYAFLTFRTRLSD